MAAMTPIQTVGIGETGTIAALYHKAVPFVDGPQHLTGAVRDYHVSGPWMINRKITCSDELMVSIINLMERAYVDGMDSVRGSIRRAIGIEGV
jgi:hypothetical protein